MAGQRQQDFRRRPGRVEEEAHALPEIHLAKLLAERNQMIVVHPDHVVVAQHGGELAGDKVVDPEISGIVAARKLGKVKPEMEKRPKLRVGEAVVIFLEVALREMDRGIGSLADMGKGGRTAGGLGGW